MKTIKLFTIITLLSMLILIGCETTKPSTKVGDIISFGGHQWRVLDIENNRALIISQNIVEQRQYHTSDTSITWSECSLRTYLNGAFYNSFSSKDRNRIVQVTNTNPNNPYYGTNGGPNTLDKIFLLSLDEAQSYFYGAADRVATWNGSASWWWLRSPGSHGSTANTVSSDGILDDYYYSGAVYGTGGVRPALWLSL